MIPIKILPKEKCNINFVFRGKEAQNFEGTLNAKIVCGTITAREV